VLTEKLRLLDFDDLYLLRQLAAGDSVVGTARHLGLTQPAVTQRLRKIEKVFGEPLVEKSGRQVKLTRTGVAICEKAMAAITAMTESPSAAEPVNLSIGINENFLKGLALDAAKSLIKQAPPFKINITTGSANHMMRLLEINRLDAVVDYAHSIAISGAEHFHTVSLGDVDLVCVAAPQLENIAKDKMGFPLAPFLDISSENSLLSFLKEKRGPSLARLDIWRLGSSGAVLSAALDGLGYSVLPLKIVAPYLESGKLTRLSLPMFNDSAELILAFGNSTRAAKGLEALLEFIKKNLS